MDYQLQKKKHIDTANSHPDIQMNPLVRWDATECNQDRSIIYIHVEDKLDRYSEPMKE